MNIAAITPKGYTLNKELLKDYVESALKHCNLNLRYIEQGINSGRLLPIVFTEQDKIIGISVLELSKEAVHIVILAGSFSKGWKSEFLDVMTKLAKSQGRSKLQCNGRKGWLRVLGKYGAKKDNELTVIEV